MAINKLPNYPSSHAEIKDLLIEGSYLMFEFRDKEVYITNDNRIAQEEDYKKAQEEGHPLHGKGYYIRQEWLENELDNILQNVNHLLY